MWNIPRDTLPNFRAEVSMHLILQKGASIGHRGFGSSKNRRIMENTILSFHQAAKSGVNWVEFDVQLTAVGSLVY